VRQHDQPSGNPRVRVCGGLLLAIGVAAPVLAGGGVPPSRRGTSEAIELAARRVIVWEDDGARWVVLSGEAAVLQGVEGLRARGAVVRITEQPAAGGPGYRAEVYAEGDVRPTSGNNTTPRPHARLELQTPKEVRLTPYDPSGLTRLAEVPHGLAIVHRSGFARGQGGSGSAPRDPQLQRSQFSRPAARSRGDTEDPGNGLPGLEPETDAEGRSPRREGDQLAPATPPPLPAGDDQEPEVELPPIEGAEELEVPNLGNPEDLPPSLEPLPAPEGSGVAPPLVREPRASGPIEGRLPSAPILPGTQRITSIFPRSGRKVDIQLLPPRPDGTRIILYRGGVNIVTKTAQFGIIDIEAESAVIWRHPDPKEGEEQRGPNGELIERANQPMEVYLEGDVIVRQDEQKVAGRGDQRTYRARRAYYDFVTDRFLALDAEVDLFAPGFIAPFKIKSPRIEQFHPLARRVDGTLTLDPNPEIRAERTVMTGSRFPNPAYQINNRSVDLVRKSRPPIDPNSGRELADPDDPLAPRDLLWRYDARQNFFYMGWLPIFYWPRLAGEIDELDPPLRQLTFRSNNYLGQQLLSDWSGFKLFGIRRPDWIDNWNIDIDYLSERTQYFPALGSEIGWFGRDLIRDLTDPYRRSRSSRPSITYDYFGYFDVWGLRDSGMDVLGSGPAVVTNGPPGAGQRGFQRSFVPPFQDFRGRLIARHMQRFLPNDEDHRFEDLRLQLEVAYLSDRHFLEEYYKRLFETGLDQQTLGYLQWQRNNWSWDLWAEANLQDFYTDSQWLPRLDYYRLGDSLLGGWLNYYQHSGINYANVHTDIMVNNPNLFAFIPVDPISNTSGVFQAFRAYTNHELDLPLNLYDVVRVVPYVQGQLVGWSDQIGGGPFFQQSTGALGRYWGAAGARAEMTAWKIYPNVENEILNIHGLNNKISFHADFRAAAANARLNSIAVQDDLDDNTYEFVRRYFALTSFNGGILPFPYDPRHLILRRTLSPITATTDIQSSITTVELGIHQRLQTKRGPEGRRRIVDWMTLDVQSTYFPYAERDNFNTSWGQTMYNWQWFLGDRTSIVSSGWFEFWPLIGSSPRDNYNVPTYNPNGLNVITSGIALSRPPRAGMFIGYSVIDTGPIQTSALNTSLSYWLSPKWYGSYSTSYDFGNHILLGSMFSLTRIGADYLLSLGLSVDPQRQSYMFAFQVSPRLSPNLRLGSGVGLNQFDSRYAPTQ
jgi:hypothetical protein